MAPFTQLQFDLVLQDSKQLLRDDSENYINININGPCFPLVKYIQASIVPDNKIRLWGFIVRLFPLQLP